MIGGWALFTQALLTDLDPNKVKIVSVDALPAELAYVDKGLAPVLLAQPTFMWGYQSVQTIFDHVYLKKHGAGARADEPGRVCPRTTSAPGRGSSRHGDSPTSIPKYLALPN